MNATIEKMLFHLTKKTNLTDISVADLSQMVTEFPFFAPAQLALAVKLKEENSANYLTQIQKTAVFFSNTYWLNYQLQNGELTNFTFPAIEQNSAVTPTTSIQDVIENSEINTVKENATIPTVNNPNSAAVTESAIVIPTVEKVKEIINSIDHPTIVATDDFNISTALKPTEELPFENKLSTVLSSQMADFKKPVDENAKLEFEKEPYYTIDYFASQGIKFDPTKQPDDKLSQQLMKFTDWLKKMKHVNPNPQDLGTDPELEKAIQGIANSSNEAKEIVTETMAEVFIKQGKLDKAVQLYIKLSFLYPEKSSYFASKIQQLKGM